MIFGGYLEAAVGAEYHGEGRHTLGEVLRTLPWARLVLADVLVVLLTGIGITLFVVPGVYLATVLALTGPLVSMQRLRSVDAMRYSARLVRPACVKVFLLVVVPVQAEHTVESFLDDLLDHLPLWLDLAITWVVASVLFAFIGLMEVADRLRAGAPGRASQGRRRGRRPGPPAEVAQAPAQT